MERHPAPIDYVIPTKVTKAYSNIMFPSGAYWIHAGYVFMRTRWLQTSSLVMDVRYTLLTSGVPGTRLGIFRNHFSGITTMWVFPKIGSFHPQIIHFKRVFHYYNHPFWGIPIFGNTHVLYQRSQGEKTFFSSRSQPDAPQPIPCWPLERCDS